MVIICVLFFHEQIRRSAIKALPSLCQDSKEHLTKIADVLTQLLQTGLYSCTDYKCIFVCLGTFLLQ